MKRAVLLLLCCVLALSHAYTNYKRYCSSTQTVTVQDTSGVVGCDGFSSGTTTWVFDKSMLSVIVTLTNRVLYSSSDKISVTGAPTSTTCTWTYGTAINSECPVTCDGSNCKITFAGSSAGTSYGWAATFYAVTCPESDTKTVADISGNIGCMSYFPSVSVLWNYIGSAQSLRLIFKHFDTQSGKDVVALSDGSSYSGTTYPTAPFYMNASTFSVSFKSDSSVEASGWLLNFVDPSYLHEITSQQVFYVKTLSDGGFVYFELSNVSSGASLVFDVTITKYQGMLPPDSYVSLNAVPTLDYYDFTNVTVQSSTGYYSFHLEIQAPVAGSWFLGVFMYGQASSMTVNANWTYSFTSLSNGQLVSDSVVPANPICYQLYTPVKTAALNLQISRKSPGGYPVAYISEGVVPTETEHQWTMDTTTTSYIKLQIPNPNPTNNVSPNPGNYIICVHALDSDSGYAFQADWA